MTSPTPWREEVALVPFSMGQRLRCVTEPTLVPVRGTVLLLPPFAEEMNKSRRMCALLSRALAVDGWRVVRIDLYGCGDSAGELRDATWQRWVDDLQLEVRRSKSESIGALWLWCIRAGALFVPALLEVSPAAHLLMWQPGGSGSQHLRQFLRLHMASSLLGADRSSLSQTSPAQQLAAGRTVEVGGYELPAAVADGLQASDLRLSSEASGRIVWFEVSPDVVPSCSPATQSAVDAICAEGHDVQLEFVHGAPFWQTTDIVENSALIDCSRDLMRADARPAAGTVRSAH